MWCMHCCWGISDIEAHLTPRLQLVKVEVVLGGIEINDVHPPRVIGCLGLIMVGNRIPWCGGISGSGARSIMQAAFLAMCSWSTKCVGRWEHHIY